MQDRRSRANDRFHALRRIVPLSRGGCNVWDNVVTSCSTCNNRKGGRLLREAGLRLLNKPVEPNYVHLVWVVRRVTRTQAKYIRMFYGKDALDAVSGGRGPGVAEKLY